MEEEKTVKPKKRPPYGMIAALTGIVMSSVIAAGIVMVTIDTKRAEADQGWNESFKSTKFSVFNGPMNNWRVTYVQQDGRSVTRYASAFYYDVPETGTRYVVQDPKMRDQVIVHWRTDDPLRPIEE
ncbi:hypothetical protein D3C74_49580 [compost metagenome]